MTIQVDDALFSRFVQACEAIGVVAVDYIELRVNEIIKAIIDDVANAPNIRDPRCQITDVDDPRHCHDDRC